MRLRVAVIGSGGAGRAHAVGYAKLSDVEMVGVADINHTRAQALSEEVHTAPFSSYQDMIKQTRPDAVSVCTPESQHAEPTIYALSHGCHVLCEKIMAHDLKSGEQMVATARNHQRMLAVNYNYRYIDSVIALKQLIESEALGELRMVSLNVHAYCHHHALDLIRFWFGEFDQVTAVLTENQAERHYGWNEADTMLYIPSVNECTAIRIGKLVVSLNACHRAFSYPLMEITCYGTNGRVKISDMMINAINGDLLIQHGGETTRIPGEPLGLDDMFYRSIEGWVDAVQGRRQISTSGLDGLRIMQIEAAISQSHAAGIPVNLGQELGNTLP